MNVSKKSVASLMAVLATGVLFASCAPSSSGNPANDKAGEAQKALTQETQCSNAYHSVWLGTYAVNANGYDDVFVTIDDAYTNVENQYTASVLSGTFNGALTGGVTFKNIASGRTVLVRLRGDRVIITGETVDTMKCQLVTVDPNSGQ